MSGVRELLDTPVTGLDLLIVWLAWVAYRMLRALGQLLGAVTADRSTDGGAAGRRIRAQDAAIQAQAQRDREVAR
ncbi:hypothetical protein [Longimicrobium sp.]|uniref:hypothetical protein n=1 Tax=Longimicrobium sp. TaxID=2029185 RepID=UPI002EDA2416